MNYRTNDAVLELPDSWHDQSIYIYSSEPPGKPGVSLVLTKEKLVNGKDLAGYKTMLMSRLPEELPGLNILRQEKLYNPKRIEFELIEHSWNSQSGLMHHYQALMVHKKSSGVFAGEETWGYCFTLSVLEVLHYPDLANIFNRIVLNFRIER